MAMTPGSQHRIDVKRESEAAFSRDENDAERHLFMQHGAPSSSPIRWHHRAYRICQRFY